MDEKSVVDGAGKIGISVVVPYFQIDSFFINICALLRMGFIF
ncbi:MAG: hypothetical protein ACTSU3_10325 [Candidatus Thorarchaeota archaeon]